MNVLFVSNYYPPRTNGGYEQWCQEVAHALAARGHRVCVLTSTGGRGGLGVGEHRDHVEVEVHRALHLEVEAGVLQTGLRLLAARKRLEQANLEYLRRVLIEQQPEVALIWGMWNVPRSVPALVEQALGPRVAYYFCDYWPTLPTAYLQQLQAPARRGVTHLPKRFVSRPFVKRLAREQAVHLRFEHPICVSKAVRRLLLQADVPVGHAQVIYGGTRVHQFTPSVEWSPKRGDLRLLYAGRVTPTKGVHTAIEALGLLAREGERRVCVTVVGGGDPDYEGLLRQLAQRAGVSDRVSFRGGVAHEEMRDVFGQHDALLLLSEWEEPFARIVLEAMAAGLVVLGTLTGGTGELLVEGETGLTLPPGDADALAKQIRRLLLDPGLYRRLANAAQRLVESRFTLEGMVDELEQVLVGLAPARHPSRI
jgi:glycosyltransferase involved in cell wall biosynthesis